MEKIEINEINEATKTSMLTRVLTGIVLALICIPCVVLGSWYFFFLMLILTIISAFEICHITGIKGPFKIFVYSMSIILTIFLVYYLFIRKNLDFFTEESFTLSTDAILIKSFNKIELSVMAIMIMAAMFFIISFLFEQFKISYVFYFISMILVVAVGIQSFLYLRYSPFYFFAKDIESQYAAGTDNAIIQQAIDDVTSTGMFKYLQSTFLFFYVVIGVFMNDIGAYFVGVLFGKHKMNPRISPHKTWEGFLGGVVISLIFSTTFAIVTTYIGMPMLPIFDFTAGKEFAGLSVVLISLLLPIIANVGDFVFSAIKRSFGVKDFSQILPGHGGVLDRIDSLIFAAALVSGLIVFFNFFVYGVTI